MGYCPVLACSYSISDMETSQDEAPSEYTEKIWGKDDGDVYITDGYTFRGKRIFSQAWEGLKNVMKKGVKNEIGAIKYKALDVRKKGVGIEADVEIILNDKRGVGVLKLYGQNSKKEHVITVSKSKESDNDQVVILAEKVVEPLMRIQLMWKIFLSKMLNSLNAYIVIKLSILLQV